ncbi:AP-5 complex subunit zeta-1 isoform X3 [Marmota marmota marmota]|uniref:AP-5 complex subunit zeta-1 isoform X3 n=1 Tax=Marmota marmota marmota TaxID=9994 RepID=UPI000762B11F|nr:AP-5 complex subunit zeta-1 isoform X3 [Marmota marmota marmota]
MFTAAAESLLHQAREIQDEELQGFCSRIIKLLREDLGPAAVDALQRLFLIVWATKYPRRLDKTCVDLLQATLCLPTCPEQLQVLCAAILREMSPSDSLTLSCDRAPNTRQMSLVASVLLAQGDRRQEVRSVGQRIFTVLESRQPEGPSLRHLLPVLSKVVGLAPGTLQEGPCFLSHFHQHHEGLGSPKCLTVFLNGTPHHRPDRPPQQAACGLAPPCQCPARAPALRGLFLHTQGPAGPITEVDGAVASDFFTVLSTGQHFTEDQWLNVQAFSMLRAWLLHKSPEGPSTLDTDDKSELEGSTLSVLSAASTATRLLPPRERLREAAFEYCQRLIEQSNRRALRKGDADLQKACLVEAILILDVLCRQDPSFLYRTLSCLKALHTRLGTDPGSERAVLPLAQFFLNHGEAAAVGSEAIYQHLLTRLPSEHFHNPMLAFEVIRFCRDNLPLFDLHLLGILKSSFPNLFKFLAWNSPPLTSEFVGLLPALVDAGTAVEMLHTLLDLPCLTAALHLQLRSSSSPSERLLWDASLRTPSCLEAFRDPQCQGLFQHLLRTKASGSAERLTLLHQLLQPMASCARVAQCAEAVPALLQAFFSAVIQSSRLLECWWLPLAAPRELNPGGAPGDRLVTAWLDAGWAAWASLQLSKTAPCLAGRLLQGEPQFAGRALTTQLALLLLERSDSLYQVPQYEARVQRVLSSQFLALCQRNPSLVVELARELLDFVGSVSNIHSRAGVFTSVVWAIGEYLSVTCDRRCTVEQINKFFEALEALLFEVTQSRPSADQPRCPPQVVTVLMTTLTKLASRSQDLIPRVSLFLSKMRTLAQGPASSSTHSEEDAEAIRIRATELLNLLKMPSVAQFVFTPSAEVCHPRYHRDTNMSLPLALRMVSRLVEKESSLLPG